MARRSLKILLFSQYFLPHIGGVEKYVDVLAKYLAQRGHIVHILTQRLSDSAKYYTSYNRKRKIHIVTLKSIKLKSDLNPLSSILLGMLDFCIKYIDYYLSLIHI